MSNLLDGINIDHLCTLFNDAHWRSLDNICSHPLKAKDIEDLGLQAMADQLRDDRERQEKDDA